MIGCTSITAASPTRTRAAASSFQLGAFVSVVAAHQVGRLAPDDAGDVPAARQNQHPLADQDLGVPAADRAEGEGAVVVDVGDDQADLVDVPGQQHLLRARRDIGPQAGDGVAVHIGRHLGAEALGLGPPDAGRLDLVVRRPRRFQQVGQECFRLFAHRAPLVSAECRVLSGS
jgi:hypothetical protein